MAKQEEKTLTEYILSQLENPVMVTEVDEKGKKQKVRAKDPVDGHELNAKEAIAMKLMNNALNGDINAAKFIMEQERIGKQMEMMKKRK